MNRLTVFSDSSLKYPSLADHFCPSERYPEYAFEGVSRAPNLVYAALRKTFQWAGLDAEHSGSARWNPLGAYIASGSRVFVLCNFVNSRRAVQSESDGQAMCAHGSVVRALVDYILIAAGPQGRVVIGNAPIQGANWDGILRETGLGTLLEFYNAESQPVEARDLRATIAERDILGRVIRTEARGSKNLVAVDLGERSCLEGAAAQHSYRVSDYDPRQTASCHGPSRHLYLMHREPLEADVVVSVPKLKTHEKVGLTCAIKGFVGAVGEKECLVHYRKGAPGDGGDEYPRESRFRRVLSDLNDWVCTRGKGTLARRAGTPATRNLGRAARLLGVGAAGAWHGNDSAWRMAVDVARIMHFADQRGTMQTSLQRRHIFVVDGVVAGEGPGPLAPRPVQCGTLVFGENAVGVDVVAAQLMGYDAGRIPIIAQAAGGSVFPLSGTLPSLMDAAVCVNGGPVPAHALKPVLGRAFAPPKGWIGHLEAARQ